MSLLDDWRAITALISTIGILIFTFWAVQQLNYAIDHPNEVLKIGEDILRKGIEEIAGHKAIRADIFLAFISAVLLIIVGIARWFDVKL